MKLEAKFIRIGRTIHNAADRSVHETHKSIGAAKRWSREFQKANGGLGCGSLIVEPTAEQKRHAAKVAKEFKEASAREVARKTSALLPPSQGKSNADVRPGSSKTLHRSVSSPQASRFLNTHGGDTASSSSRRKSGKRGTGLNAFV